MWETLSDTPGQRQEVPQLILHETVVYWVTAPFLHYVHCNTGRMVVAGKKDPSKTILAPNFPSHLETVSMLSGKGCDQNHNEEPCICSIHSFWGMS